MTWYKEMTEQQKREFKKVITVSVIGAIIVLFIPISSGNTGFPAYERCFDKWKYCQSDYIYAYGYRVFYNRDYRR